MNGILSKLRGVERFDALVIAAVRMALGWHLAYLGVWALTSTWTYSWFGRFQCAHWRGGGFFRAIAGSSAMDVVDLLLPWCLLVSGVCLLLGRFVKPAALFGVFYLLLLYVLNPPHFGHTGESHFLFIDRNLVEVALFLFVWAWCGESAKAHRGAEKEAGE